MASTKGAWKYIVGTYGLDGVVREEEWCKCEETIQCDEVEQC
jgi:hypothetical protein